MIVSTGSVVPTDDCFSKPILVDSASTAVL